MIVMTIFGKRYRIKAKGNFALLVVLIIVFIMMISNALSGANAFDNMIRWEHKEIMAYQNGSLQWEYVKIIVEHGDTLWNIASKYMTNNIDIRRAVHILCRFNGIYAHELKAGQTLRIPIN